MSNVGHKSCMAGAWLWLLQAQTCGSNPPLLACFTKLIESPMPHRDGEAKEAQRPQLSGPQLLLLLTIPVIHYGVF